ncbi:zinc-dependent metalloprotease family protein [Nocardioides sp. SYSU DS0651]|uniref:zinc-dependent metalloprotease family protein n=1 Tax=Nocardioides sp. SYSU DS0651 TaxID=3415955 RepID=UPI003F4B764E
MKRLSGVVAAGVSGLAIAISGLALPAAAEETPPTVTEDPAVADDPALHVAEDGVVYAEDVWHGVPEETETAGTDGTELDRAETLASYTLADTFTLHSRPGASRTIYLDFDGGVLGSDNSWLKDGDTKLAYPAWSLDSNASAFTDSERTGIQEIWARMAEDFAPFDVDVTTEEPAAGALFRSSSGDTTFGSRVAFTSGSTVQQYVCSSGCGGIAWVGTFDAITSGETRSPAWVFPSSLSNRPKNMAEAASHEVGHNLGLSHDGTTTRSYYSGTQLWGPIMGSPYSASVTQWSRGEYTAANNHEDDFARAQANGVALRADEAGNTPATAAPLSALPTGSGILTSSRDQDWFALETCSGTVSAKATPAAVGPNVDLRVEVRNASGEVLAAHAPATSRTVSGLTGMSAAVSVPLSGGPYYVGVSGTGSGADGAAGWADGGYGSYGSTGSYQLSVTGCDGGSTPRVSPPPTTETPVSAPGRPRRPRVWSGGLGGRLEIGVRWYPPSSTGGAPVTGYLLASYRLGYNGRVIDKRRTGVRSADERRLTWRLPRGRWVVKVKARNSAGWSALSSRSYVVRPR